RATTRADELGSSRAVIEVTPTPRSIAAPAGSSLFPAIIAAATAVSKRCVAANAGPERIASHRNSPAGIGGARGFDPGAIDEDVSASISARAVSIAARVLVRLEPGGITAPS